MAKAEANVGHYFPTVRLKLLGTTKDEETSKWAIDGGLLAAPGKRDAANQGANFISDGLMNGTSRDRVPGSPSHVSHPSLS
jgi:hypothetical protein